ncbi:MAG TPA: DUF4238 domain-containing protein [Opitutaceae bacterium]|jgi:hypothetical protein|nr:DUF4238 domain-containing protein [Opitutaceae bacterium]
MTSQNRTHRNHYVPEWYQRRFLPHGVDRFFYLDLKPDVVKIGPGRSYTRKSLLRWGPSRCFYQDNLYTLKLGAWTTDAIEHEFFGPIDDRGKSAVSFFADYSISDKSHEAFKNIMPYMDAQRLRTPRGLDWLKFVAKTSDQNRLLQIMARVFQLHATMWTEGVWEVVRADSSQTKFLVTDQPVTFYNSTVFPASPKIPYPLDAQLQHVGTRTIFPLSSERCLIITHLQLVRNPWTNPGRSRVNARSYQSAMFDLQQIQTDRQLTDNEVTRINFILKRRATRYIAAADEEWLHPERHLSTTHWSKLDEDWFLFPNLYKVQFSSGIVAGWDDGSSWASDEYGRLRNDPHYQDKKQHGEEWVTAQKAKLAWAVKREGRSAARSHHQFNDGEDRIMKRELARYHEGIAKKRPETAISRQRS